MADRVFLDRYRLMEPLRQRGMATTFRALDERNGQVVAVKLVPTPPASREHLAREFAIGSRLSHTNVIRYLDHFEAEDCTGLVTELVEGEPFLSELARVEPNTFGDRTASAFRQLCEALEYLHARGWVHANLSPAVILWTASGVLKLIALGHCEEFASETDPLAGEFHGTPIYFSPEHGRVRLVVESDHFVVGILLVEHLTGTNPLRTNNIRDLRDKLWTLAELRSSVRLPRLPRSWRRLVDSLLAADPAGRRSGWRDFLTRLKVGGV